MFRFDGHTKPVRCAAFSPDGHHLASGGDDRTVRVWDRGTAACERTFTGHAGAVWSVAFHPNGLEVVSSGAGEAQRDSAIHFWLLADPAALAALAALAAATPPDPNSLHALFQKVADRLPHLPQWQQPEFVKRAKDLIAQLPQWEQPEFLKRVKERFPQMPQWELSGAVKRTYESIWAGSGVDIHSLAFVRGGLELLGVCADHASEVGKVTRWQVLGASAVELGAGGNWLARRAHVSTMAVSADGETVAVASEQYIRAGRLDAPQVPPGYVARGKVRSLALTPDGSRLAGCWGNRVTVWDAAGGSEVREFDGHTGEVRAVAGRPDGSALASAGLDGSVIVWEPDTGSVRARYDWELGPVHALAFAPDGLTLAVAGDGGLALFDFE